MPVKEPASSDCLRAHKRYRAAHAYVAATFIGTFFPELPLAWPGRRGSPVKV